MEYPKPSVINGGRHDQFGLEYIGEKATHKQATMHKIEEHKIMTERKPHLSIIIPKIGLRTPDMI